MCIYISRERVFKSSINLVSDFGLELVLISIDLVFHYHV